LKRKYWIGRTRAAGVDLARGEGGNAIDTTTRKDRRYRFCALIREFLKPDPKSVSSGAV